MKKNQAVQISGEKGSNRAPEGLSRHHLKKVTLDFPDFQHVNGGCYCTSFSENRTSKKNQVPELWVKKCAKMG